MKIGIIGSGYIGGTTARLFIDAGHEVALSNSRGPKSLAQKVEELGAHARAVTPAEAAKFGDVVLLAVPLKNYVDLPVAELRGKIAIDAMNYYPDRDGQIALLDSGETTSSSLVAQHLAGARVVKAFNTIWFEHLRSEAKKDAPVEKRRAIFVSGDDDEAKAIVSKLIEEIGFGPLDLGTLAESSSQEPGSPLYNRQISVEEARAETSAGF
jgi:predicted dinucleotide-binding enzyme